MGEAPEQEASDPDLGQMKATENQTAALERVAASTLTLCPSPPSTDKTDTAMLSQTGSSQTASQSTRQMDSQATPQRVRADSLLVMLRRIQLSLKKNILHILIINWSLWKRRTKTLE